MLSTISKLHSVEEQTHPEVKEANDRFLQIQEEQRQQEEELEQRHIELKFRLLHSQQEQRQKEDELQKRTAELELTNAELKKHEN